MGNKSLKIMIVEDEGIIALSLKEILEAWGHRVGRIAVSGEEAVELAGKDHPDLVLMDIKICGKVDGIEAARTIGRLYAKPVIFVSGYIDENTLLLMKGVSPAGIISKPVDFDKLGSMLEHL